MGNASRNYDTISPSAKMVLLMKGFTDIPYAKQVADMLGYPENYVPKEGMTAFFFWMRVAHLELRYKSINTLLEGLGIKNIMELSSGWSFRGLDVVKNENVHYIDTDLPGIIDEKKQMMATLQGNDTITEGKLEILPVNALDEAAFTEAVNRFGEGPVAIVNEGLLMYLDNEEKKKLCGNIRRVLQERGGYWITADIYFKMNMPPIEIKDDLQKLLDEHDIENNKFENEEEARAFFREQGFEIDQEMEPDIRQAKSVDQLMKYVTAEMLASGEKPPKIHVTWRLKLAGS